jgi:hypothetical protein
MLVPRISFANNQEALPDRQSFFINTTQVTEAIQYWNPNRTGVTAVSAPTKNIDLC